MDENELQRLIKLQQVQDSFSGLSDEEKMAQFQQAQAFQPSRPGSGPLPPDETAEIQARAAAIRSAREDAMNANDPIRQIAEQLARSKRNPL